MRGHWLPWFAILTLVSASCRVAFRDPKPHQESDQQTTSSRMKETLPPLPPGILDLPPGPLADLVAEADAHNLQVIYTRIERRPDGTAAFTDHAFHLRPDRYFYPASTVKLPVAILALQRLRELAVPGLDRNTTFLTEAGAEWQTAVTNDPMTPDGRPTVTGYIRRIFQVSDNDAYNRLYEFLGPGYINRELQKRGYPEAEIIHRLEVPLDEVKNRITNPVCFLDASGRVVYRQPALQHDAPYAARQDRLGKAYLQRGRKVEGPMDFSRKNRLHLLSLHRMLQSVLYPESVPPEQRFGLADDDLAFLRTCLSSLPGEGGPPAFDPVAFPATYCKFLFFGADPKESIPPYLKVYNKVGDAYGHLLDIACFEDRLHGVEFLLSAVVYVNSDGVLNDDRYDYDSLGLPLLAEIGKRVYAHERRLAAAARAR